MSLRTLLEPSEKPKVMYTENSLEFGKLVKIYLGINHCTSTPHRSETSGIAERAVRRIQEGTAAVLLHSGLDEKWWADSMECYCYLRHVQDLLSDGKTLHERRYPISAKDQSRVHQICEKVVTWNIPRICIVRGGNLGRRYFGR